MADQENRRLILNNVTAEQEDQIRAFLNFFEEFEDIQVEAEERPRPRPEEPTAVAVPRRQAQEEQENLPPLAAGLGLPVLGPGVVAEHAEPVAGRCPECFISPCVTQEVLGQSWFADVPLPAHKRNSPLRKVIYHRIWTVIGRLGGWRNHLYLEKKQRLLTEARGRQADFETLVRVRREIIPDCVLDLVRSRYPNPPKQPYMGHKWW